jgi:hypothetical protein
MADGDGDRAGWPLDPIDRLSEVMFGLLMALTFTGTMSVSLGEGATVRDILLAAIGCNIAWGLVDAVVYLMTTSTERARGQTWIAAIRRADGDEARSLARQALPGRAGETLRDDELDVIVGWLRRQPEANSSRRLGGADLRAAVLIFLLVIGATFPPILPFLLTDQVMLAMRLSNAAAVAMLFGIGWFLDREIADGSYAMRWTIPFVGVIMVAVTIALGG